MDKRRYTGRASLKLDAKGRLVVPGFCRAYDDRVFYVTVGRKRCLEMMDMERYGSMIERIDGLDEFDEKRSDIARVFSSGSDLEVDSHGRISIPKELRDYASLSGDVVVVGLISHMEIWDREAFESEHASNIANYGRNLQEIANRNQG